MLIIWIRLAPHPPTGPTDFPRFPAPDIPHENWSCSCLNSYPRNSRCVKNINIVWLVGGGFNHLEKYEFVNGRDYPIYYGKEEMFEATNQMIFPHIPTTDYQK